MMLFANDHISQSLPVCIIAVLLILLMLFEMLFLASLIFNRWAAKAFVDVILLT